MRASHDKTIARILFLGSYPNLQKCDRAPEHGARDLHMEARKHCDAVGDVVNKLDEEKYA
jgi:bacterioferritin